MESRITIEVDFQNNNNPVIQLVIRESSDVRDKLLSYFTELLGRKSSWARLEYIPGPEGSKVKTWKISPIVPDMMGKEANEMMARYEDIPIQNSPEKKDW